MYTALLGVLVLLATTSSAPAQVDLSVDPTMVQGPLEAPVTIVEFSDFQ